MKKQSSQFTRLRNIKYFLQRFTFVTLVLITFALMLIGKADTIVIDKVSSVITDIFKPVIVVMGAPANVVFGIIQNIEELAAIRDQNTRLRLDNSQLMKWASIANQLESENRQLRKYLSVVDEPFPEQIIARVVADTGGAFAKSVIITGGSNVGIEKGQAVVTEVGLVGRVTQAGNTAARVLLINDINSRIPVRVGEAGYRAILAGKNSIRPSIMYLGLKSPVSLGDNVITSGDAGAFPPGLQIGKVISIDNDNVLVDTFASRDRLQFVRVLKYKILTDFSEQK